ncbi:MAG TPA: tRNA-uridine aminocarboxypropyltransferase [Candidatus Binatia bacterium]
MKLTRNRNIKDPCPICAASRTLCLCDTIPRIELDTRICLVIHHRELRRSSNTGLLALRALVNSEMRIRGETKDTLDLSDLVTSRYRTFLFYPSDNAVELDKELVAQDPRPIQLIVPDGTWRQARKVHYRHPELENVQRVRISTPNSSIFQLRAQHKPGRMATLQAIAQGLGVIEGDLVEAQLIKLYHAKVERTLIGRGLLRSK